MINIRHRLLTGFFLLWSLVICSMLVYWQVVKSADLKLVAISQQTASVVIPSARGEILFSDGHPLSSNAQNYLMYVEPQKLTPQLSPIIDLLRSESASESAIAALESAKTRTHLSWLPITQRLSPSTKAAIESLKLSGIGFESAPLRSYPEGTPSAYITGFVGKNDSGDPQGYFGLEGYYNKLLSGTPGRLVEQLDAFGLPITIGGRYRIAPKDGDNLVTSVDRTVQFLAFQELTSALARFQSPSGTVTVLESKTGRVLAMVSIPGYDPYNYTDFHPDLYKNPIVSEGIEPGSTFKTIVMVSALDAGVVKPETICTICSGPVTIGDSVVRSYNHKYYPNSTMSDVILHSDNVGMVYVSRQLGKTKLLNYLRAFGFGSLTGIELQEEDTPPLRPNDQWYEIDWATTSFGQGIAVTPLQMVAAVNAIANRGLYLPPRIVIQTGKPQTYKTVPPPNSKRVVSTTAASQITAMMVNGVNTGEVRYYRPQGYLIAGKTGTAQVPISGHYDPDKVIASFVGFAPADDPKFTMLVTLRDPKPSPWGSTTAAPTWFNIARQLFRYYGLSPMVN